MSSRPADLVRSHLLTGARQADYRIGDQACAAGFAIVTGMSPTIFRYCPFRFFFFSREEDRLHVHVQSADGEAKFWIEPVIELARS